MCLWIYQQISFRGFGSALHGFRASINEPFALKGSPQVGHPWVLSAEAAKSMIGRGPQNLVARCTSHSDAAEHRLVVQALTAVKSGVFHRIAQRNSCAV